MSEKNWLIDWIHRVETDIDNPTNSSKRLPGIVTELYFEKALKDHIWPDIPKQLAFGWCFKLNYGSPPRKWFKVTDGSDWELNRLLIKSVKGVAPDDQFFVIEPNIEFPDDDSAPLLTWRAGRIEFKGTSDRLKFSIDASLSEELNAYMAEAIAKREDLDACYDLDISPWLKNLDLFSLRRLFATRCLMNFGELYLTDLDAVGLSQSGNLEILEFKRKTPATGIGYELANINPVSSPLDTYIEKAKELTKLDKEGKQSPLTNAKLWNKRKERESFGLDLSHARTVSLCDKAGITYRHIVWNSEKSAPASLLDESFKLKVSPDFLTLNLLPFHFDSLTKTKGDDSGTYSKELRFQITVAAALFKPLACNPASLLPETE